MRLRIHVTSLAWSCLLNFVSGWVRAPRYRDIEPLSGVTIGHVGGRQNGLASNCVRSSMEARDMISNGRRHPSRAQGHLDQLRCKSYDLVTYGGA